MTESRPNEGKVAEELQQLGKNLSEVMRAVWESPERKRLQEEVTSGLNELGDVIKTEVNRFSESPTGQRVREETEEFGQKVRSGEVEGKVRQELLTALQSANAQLQKVISSLQKGPSASARSEPEGGQRSPSAETGHKEIHPDDMSAGPADTPHQEIHPDDVDYPQPPEGQQ